MPDLVIGGRRTGTPRPWRAGVIAIALLFVAIIVAWFIYRRSVAYDMPGGDVQGSITQLQAAPGAPPALVFASSSLAYLGSIPVLRTIGDAHAIGAAHGRLLAPAIPAVVRAHATSIEDTVGSGGLFGGMTHGMRLAWRWRFVDDGFTDPDRRMVAGMTRGAAASGVDVSYDDVLRDQAVLDVGVPSPRTAEADQHGVALSLTILARSQQQPARLWIGRSFSLPGLDDGGESAATPVITIAHPEGRIAWAGVGWAGELGVVSGVNAQNIAVMVHPTRTGDVRVTRTARPIAHLARAVLEQAKTLDEAVKIIETTPTLGAAVYVIADGTGTWVLLERTPTKAIVERAPKVPAVGDVLTTNALSSDPENDRARRMLPTLSRVDRAARLVRNPLTDVASLATILRDQRGLDDAPRPVGHRGVIDDGRAVHVLILDPTSLEMWIADPIANGRMRGLDLRHELRGEGERPAPPADIPPDPGADPDRLASLVAARADLRIARGALDDDDLDAAAEACARARARVVALPEALELDAFVAQARGDDVRARAAFQAWLDGSPDDPKGEERARALLNR